MLLKSVKASGMLMVYAIARGGRCEKNAVAETTLRTHTAAELAAASFDF